MGAIDLTTKDYIGMSLDAVFANDDIQAVCQRLGIHRGKYWRDPTLGSRLYLLRRSKDVARVIALAKQYADEALTDLVPSRFSSIVVNASQSEPSRLNLNIEVERLNGQKQNIIYFVPVGQ